MIIQLNIFITVSVTNIPNFIPMSPLMQSMLHYLIPRGCIWWPLSNRGISHCNMVKFIIISPLRFLSHFCTIHLFVTNYLTNYEINKTKYVSQISVPKESSIGFFHTRPCIFISDIQKEFYCPYVISPPETRQGHEGRFSHQDI